MSSAGNKSHFLWSSGAMRLEKNVAEKAPIQRHLFLANNNKNHKSSATLWTGVKPEDKGLESVLAFPLPLGFSSII